jgi:hypothetical protein
MEVDINNRQSLREVRENPPERLAIPEPGRIASLIASGKEKGRFRLS